MMLVLVWVEQISVAPLLDAAEEATEDATEEELVELLLVAATQTVAVAP